jgi:hypothetical protein
MASKSKHKPKKPKPKRSDRNGAVPEQNGAAGLPDELAVFGPRPAQSAFIYRYWNGSVMVAADPLELLFAINEEGDLAHDVKLAQLTGAAVATDSMRAVRRIVEVVRRVFHVEHYCEDVNGKPTGLTDPLCVALLDHFGRYCEEIKKKVGPLPSSATSARAASAGPSPPLSDSASTSTATSSMPGEASSSSTPSGSHSETSPPPAGGT